ncbi:MAG: hypothetical protein WCJ35_22405 [Planctomycetota bacterium]
MARESQGVLQVLVIIFVMLTVVLGVTTYLYNQRADEATKAAKAAGDGEKQAQDKTVEKQKECDALKRLIGFPERSTEEIEKQFVEDMATYGNAKKPEADPDKANPDKANPDKANSAKPLFDPSTLFYSRLLAGMNKVIQDRSDDLIRSRDEVTNLRKKFDKREAAKDEAIATINKGYSNTVLSVKEVSDTYNAAQQANATASVQNVKVIVTSKQDAAAAIARADDVVKASRTAVQIEETKVRALTGERNKVERQEMDVPSGEITWVSLPNKMVWINRGRADALQRGTKFSVFSADSNNAAKAVKKGTVEVTRIEGDHSSQARILDDKLTDPIMAGDKVFTPLWSPGQQNHFALTGIMNLDGDGRNQLKVVRGMINDNGGAVDCELDEKGHKIGQVTVNTRIIVIGDPPDKSSPEVIKSHGEILRDAEHYQIRKMTLSDFKERMGYQKSNSVEHFGSGAATSSGTSRAGTPKAGSTPKATPKSEE